MVVQDHGLVSQLPDQQVLLLGLDLERQYTLKLFLGRLERLRRGCGGLLLLVDLLPQVLDLGLRILDYLA